LTLTPAYLAATIVTVVMFVGSGSLLGYLVGNIPGGVVGFTIGYTITSVLDRQYDQRLRSLKAPGANNGMQADATSRR